MPRGAECPVRAPGRSPPGGGGNPRRIPCRLVARDRTGPSPRRSHEDCSTRRPARLGWALLGHQRIRPGPHAARVRPGPLLLRPPRPPRTMGTSSGSTACSTRASWPPRGRWTPRASPTRWPSPPRATPSSPSLRTRPAIPSRSRSRASASGSMRRGPCGRSSRWTSWTSPSPPPPRPACPASASPAWTTPSRPATPSPWGRTGICTPRSTRTASTWWGTSSRRGNAGFMRQQLKYVYSAPTLELGAALGFPTPNNSAKAASLEIGTLPTVAVRGTYKSGKSRVGASAIATRLPFNLGEPGRAHRQCLLRGALLRARPQRGHPGAGGAQLRAERRQPGPADAGAGPPLR